MKKNYILQTFVMLVLALTTTAQQGINYKAIINDANGDALVTTAITIQFTILESGTTEVYKETHNPTTDAHGIIIVNIGEGSILSGDFNAINWGNNAHFLKTEIDKGDGFADMGITEFKSVPYAQHAKTAESVNGSTITTYSVGDLAQGGIVFWVDETGQHGLVCSKEDQFTGIRWFGGTFDRRTFAMGDGPFSGELNTAIIIAGHAAGDNGSTYPARICNELQITEGGKTYGDWYLPSKEELKLCFQYAYGATFRIHPFEYWSSTEYNSSETWTVAFDNPYMPPIVQRRNKNETLSRGVRAIRAF